MQKQEKANVPALRFAGFTEPWEQRKLEEIASRSSETSTDCLLPRIEYEDITSGIGQLNKDVMKKKSCKTGLLFHEGDVLYGKLRPYLQHWLLPSFSGIAVGDFWILQPQRSDSGFVYQLIQTKQFEKIANQSTGTKMPRADWKLVSKSNFSIPQTIDEQKKIGTVFRYLDRSITLHQQKHALLCNLKKSMLQKMFPQNGASVPELRFAGFTEPWEECKLGELYKINNERNTELISASKTFSVATMTFNKNGNGASDSSIPKYKVLRVGDVAFEGHSSKEFRYGRFVLNNVETGIMSPRFTALRPIVKQDYNFWEYYIHSEQVMKNILVNATKAGTMMNELVPNDLFSQYILVPEISEQQKIGTFFCHFDRLIALHQRKLELLQKLKKSLLQKMFV